MVVIKSLRRALGLLVDQPVLFVPFAAYGVLQVPQLFIETLDPTLAAVGSLLFSVALLFVTPALYAGGLGMANDADRGIRTSLARFGAHAREHYVSVLGAYLFITAITIGFAVLIAIAAFATFAVLFAGGGGPIAVVVVVGAILLIGLAMLAVLFALHFCAHAIVVEGVGAVTGLQRSVEVVRSNLVPVLGYAVLSVVAGTVVGGLYALALFLAFPSATEPGVPASMPDPTIAVAGALGSILFMTLSGGLFAAFTLVLYRRLNGLDVGDEWSGDDPSSDDDPSDDDGLTAGDDPADGDDPTGDAGPEDPAVTADGTEVR